MSGTTIPLAWDAPNVITTQQHLAGRFAMALRGLVILLSVVLGACTGRVSESEYDVSGSDIDGAERGAVSGDDAVEANSQALVSGKQTKGTVLYADYIEAQMLQWAARDAPLLRVIPEGSVVKVANSTPENGYYQVIHCGTWGWIDGIELSKHHEPISGLSARRQDALELAQSAMGFSYWWSNARWSVRGATYWPTDNRGECAGNCPKCTHRATGSNEEYGVDCAGLISTVWGYWKDNDPDTNYENDGYDTSGYVKKSRWWNTIALADVITGDAVVRHDSVKEHIFMVGDKPDARGYIATYECVGCAVGCTPQRRRRTSLSGWTPIRTTRWPSY